MDSTVIAAALESDPLLKVVIQLLAFKEAPSAVSSWRKLPFEMILLNLVPADYLLFCTLS